MKTIPVYSYEKYDHQTGSMKIATHKATEEAILSFEAIKLDDTKEIVDASKIDDFGRYKL